MKEADDVLAFGSVLPTCASSGAVGATGADVDPDAVGVTTGEVAVGGSVVGDGTGASVGASVVTTVSSSRTSSSFAIQKVREV